jgi:hypothetical protein
MDTKKCKEITKMIFLTRGKAVVRGIFLGLVQEKGEVK